jgi:uncharacterized protein
LYRSKQIQNASYLFRYDFHITGENSVITDRQAFNYIQCPHRVALDLRAPLAEMDEADAFTEMLWDHAIAHEKEVLASLNISFDLSNLSAEARASETLAAMARGEALIYKGRLVVGDRESEPDLLALVDGKYRAGDIKSGSGFDGEEDAGKLKKDYAIPLAHSTELLEELGFSDGTGTAFIIDESGATVLYPLKQAQSICVKESFSDGYKAILHDLRAVVVGSKKSLPAMASTCKQCHWHTHCEKAVIEADDLTLIVELGRSKRDILVSEFPTVAALAKAELDDYAAGDKGKTIFKGIGLATLQKFKARANLLLHPESGPYLKYPVSLPSVPYEVLFDIEDDPMRSGFVYLHGFIERQAGRPETASFRPCIADDVTPEAEEKAFDEAWTYLSRCVARGDTAIYYYAPHEKIMYKQLAKRFPAVCSVADVEALFDNPLVVDLYTTIIRKATEWPTHDMSIKTIARFLGFEWRDPNPSGAASIQWFDAWVKSRDPDKFQRILDYNEDDNRATGVVVAGIRQLRLLESVSFENTVCERLAA